MVEKELWGPFDRAIVVDCDVDKVPATIKSPTLDLPVVVKFPVVVIFPVVVNVPVTLKEPVETFPATFVVVVPDKYVIL